MRIQTRETVMELLQNLATEGRSSGHIKYRLDDDPWVQFVLVLRADEVSTRDDTLRVHLMETWCREQCRGRFKHLSSVALGFECQEDAVLCLTFHAEPA